MSDILSSKREDFDGQNPSPFSTDKKFAFNETLKVEIEQDQKEGRNGNE